MMLIVLGIAKHRVLHRLINTVVVNVIEGLV